MNRTEFINSVNGIKYPELLVDFFDQFIALKQLVDDYGTVEIEGYNQADNIISFIITFISSDYEDRALNTIFGLCGNIDVYDRQIKIDVQVLTDRSIKIILK